MRAVGKLLQPIRRRISLIVTRAVVSLVDDTTTLQALQARLLAGETMDGLERFQDYGFSSHPHPGAEAIALSVGGHRSNTIIIKVDDRRYRLKALKQGEVALYTDEGDHVHLKRGRVVEIQTDTLHVKADTEVQLDTPLVWTTGQIRADLDITDQVPAGGQSMQSMRQVYNSHTHPERDNGGPTNTPNQQMGG